MAISPSVNNCLKRFFISYNGYFRKNELIANYCLLRRCNSFNKRNVTTNYYKLTQSTCTFSTKCQQFSSNENNSDDTESEEEELTLNNGDDSDEEREKTTNQIEKQKIYANNNDDNYKNSTFNTENEKRLSPYYIKKNKKFKYDADVTIQYEDICELPEHFFSFPPTEEEIKHINSGGADYNYGNYNCTVSFSGNSTNNEVANKSSKN